MRHVFIVAATIMMVSCAKFELEESVGQPVTQVPDPTDTVTVDRKGSDWQIHSLYFMDKRTWRVRAKFRKVQNEPRWNYHEIDSVSDYQVLDDAARSFLMRKTYESDDVLKQFTHHGDTIKIYHCGDYPKESPIYSLLVVTKKAEF